MDLLPPVPLSESYAHPREYRCDFGSPTTHERDYVDRVLLAASSLLRDRVVAAIGGGSGLLLNPDVARSSPDVMGGAQ